MRIFIPVFLLFGTCLSCQEKDIPISEFDFTKCEEILTLPELEAGHAKSIFLLKNNNQLQVVHKIGDSLVIYSENDSFSIDLTPIKNQIAKPKDFYQNYVLSNGYLILSDQIKNRIYLMNLYDYEIKSFDLRNLKDHYVKEVVFFNADTYFDEKNLITPVLPVLYPEVTHPMTIKNFPPLGNFVFTDTSVVLNGFIGKYPSEFFKKYYANFSTYFTPIAEHSFIVSFQRSPNILIGEVRNGDTLYREVKLSPKYSVRSLPIKEKYTRKEEVEIHKNTINFEKMYVLNEKTAGRFLNNMKEERMEFVTYDLRTWKVKNHFKVMRFINRPYIIDGDVYIIAKPKDHVKVFRIPKNAL
ncbi:hypothetical protein [Thermaurantimonas aggregans]|uniref:hypothetical protein n=1 Tax=Thermaurantimonas aggregans TaxID=2173829 RepID=UPI0023F0951C|nr:hypothetical protein [Thermaurantimonas aggregans]MCX8149368.1 hypothetical protein [Thermaurantimonas aggregans]